MMNLRQVPPCFSTQQGTHNTSTYAVFGGKLALKKIAGSISEACLDNLFVSKFGTGMIHTVVVTIFCNLIRHIISMRSEKQMTRVAARRIVAFMANYHFVGDRAVGEFIGNTMRKSRFSGALSDANPAISGFEFGCLPFPAIMRSALVYILPKANFEWAKVSVMTADKSARFSFNPTASSIIANRYFSFLSATAVAITVWDFICGRVRGMLIHVNLLLSAIGRATGCFQHRRGISIGFTGVSIPLFDVKINHFLARYAV